MAEDDLVKCDLHASASINDDDDVKVACIILCIIIFNKRKIKRAEKNRE